MTCIAAVVEPSGTVWMGADSAGVSGLDIVARADEKVFARKGYLIGFTSSFRMGDILRFLAALPSPPASGDLRRFMVVRFVEAVRKALKKYGFAAKKSEQESGGTFLVATRGRIFYIDSDYQVGESVHGFDAVGRGESYALGALHATAGWGTGGDRRVLDAIGAAIEFSTGVCGPAHVLGITRGGKKKEMVGG